MPRAVLISVGELSLEPIKTLIESHGVTTVTIAVSDTANLRSLEALFNKLSEQAKKAECILVDATNDAEKNVSAFTGVTTHLIFSSPETYLTQRLVATQGSEDAHEITQQYIGHLQSALNAFEQDNALSLCSIDDILANPALFIKAVCGKDCEEYKDESTNSLVYQTMTLSAAAALVDKDEVFELYDVALSIGQLFGEFSVHLSPDSDTFKNASSVLARVAKTIQQKSQQITTLNQKNIESTVNIAEKEQELNKANEQLAAKQQECSALQQSLETKSKELNAKAKEADATKAKLNEKESQCSQLTEQRVKVEEQNNALGTELEKQKQVLANSIEQLAAKEKEYRTLQYRFDENSKELNAKVKEADVIKVKLNEKETQCIQLKEQRAKAVEQNNALGIELEKQKQELANSIEQLTVKEKEYRTLQHRFDENSKELNAKVKEADVIKIKLNEKETQCIQLNEQREKAVEQNNALGSELEKQKQVLANTIEQLAAKEKEYSTLQICLDAKTEELNTKAKDAEEFQIKLREKLSQCNQLTQELSEQKQEAELSHLQVVQLQEELEVAVQRGNKLAPIEQELKASNEKVSQLQKKLTAADEAQKLLMLQITQLQEELNVTVQKANKLAPIEQTLKTSNEKVLQLQKKLTAADEAQKLLILQTEQLQQNLTNTNEEAKLAALQITQLQEELERTFSERESFKVKEKEAITELNKQLQANKHFKGTQAELGLLKEQLSRLQQGLEKAESEKEVLAKELSELQKIQTERAGAATISSEKLQNTELELELASLQISQLQEELEHYYLNLQERERSLQQGLTDNTMSNKIQTKVFDKTAASELSITGMYSEGDYQDIHLNLLNVTFPNGKQIANVKAKLINMSGHIGIEFRAEENEALFREFEDSSDEYGAYLRYFLTAPENLQSQQQKMVERLNASERLIIMGCINTIAELLQHRNIQTTTEVTTEQWRIWRKSAIALSDHVDTLPNWLSFDRVQLREEFATNGYEHLWLIFYGVLVGNVWRNTLELKLTANNVGAAKNGEFSEAINIEFRELEDGSAPLMTWPPASDDEYGPKLNIRIDNLTPLNELVIHDKQLITHLVNNLISILEKLEVDVSDMSRSKRAWKSAIKALLADESTSSEQQVLQEVGQEDREAATEVGNTLTCDEVVNVGSYQHLVFTQKGNGTKIKLRAENVNPETFDAEVYLELRDGTNNVIYNDSDFFGEDDYGPRVKIPAETLEALLEVNEYNQFLWAVSVYQDIAKNVELATNIDDLVKLLWKNILNRKSEK